MTHRFRTPTILALLCLLAAVATATDVGVLTDIAAHFNMPVESISPDTRFTEDLLADPVDVFELVVTLCAEHGVQPPDDLPATVADLIEQLRTAPPVPESIKDLDAEGMIHVQDVLYATTRAADPDGELGDAYGGARAAPGRGTEYGLCEVTIPVQAHKPGELESPNLLKLEFREDPRKHVVIRSVERLEPGMFWDRLGDDGGKPADPANDVLVFIHGFNMSFDKAVRRTAQMCYDLSFPGESVLFTWPSDGSLLEYLSDREDVEWSVPFFEAFLRDLADRCEGRRPHLIAHSMGNQCLIRTLDGLARSGDAPLFENVVFAAPDFDARTFAEHVAPRIGGLARRFTLYQSDRDVALDASRVLSVPRLGTPLVLTAGLDVIDASGLSAAPWSVPEVHAYYATIPKVLEDLAGVLRGMSPDERGLPQGMSGGRRFWSLTGR